MINPAKKLKGKTVLVTGGAGFIGSHLIDRLLSYGARVICFDDLSTGRQEYIDSKKDDRNFIFIKGDANEMKDIKKAFSHGPVDYVFHYAALVGVQRTIEEPLKVLKDIDGIKHILELALQHKIKKIAYASSSEIYGNQEKMPLHEENSYYDIKMPYALVKSAGENFFRSHWELSGVPVVIYRFFNAYGPRQASSMYGFVTGVFISQVLQNIPPTIFYDGKQTRDFMYIDDNIEASIQGLLNDKTTGETINLGTGRETTILELANKIIKISGKKLKPSLLNKRNLIEIKRRVADTAKMKKIIGYRPRVSLEDGLRRTYDWYANNPQFIAQGERTTYAWRKKNVWAPIKKSSKTKKKS